MTERIYSDDPYVKEFPEIAVFWDAAERSELLLPTCIDCGKAHWHPRAFCPLCGSQRIDWKTASGMGTLYSYSVNRKQEGMPIVAYVQLEEGPMMMSNVVGVDASALKIDQALKVAFRRDEEGRKVPVFAPLTKA